MEKFLLENCKFLTKLGENFHFKDPGARETMQKNIEHSSISKSSSLESILRCLTCLSCGPWIQKSCSPLLCCVYWCWAVQNEINLWTKSIFIKTVNRMSKTWGLDLINFCVTEFLCFFNSIICQCQFYHQTCQIVSKEIISNSE